MTTEDFDVVIVGAGLSGIGAAYYLQQKCKDKRYLILEGRERLGGTWDLFRYPGIRSDSDMHTLGYGFKPWRAAKAIADGPSILHYVNETAVENNITPHIRYQHWVQQAAWCSQTATWTVTAVHQNQPLTFRCNFLWLCPGYYSYENGYTPEFNGRHRFQGQIIHPQHWPQSLDYAGKKIVVIGSGATAVTLIPALADQAQHVTMLQRSPSYIASVPQEDSLANQLRQHLPERLAYSLIRSKNIIYQQLTYQFTRRYPEKAKQQLISAIQAQLGPDYDIESHFTPHYNPWDQRLCVVPDGDLFQAIKSGQATIVTDQIATFTENGILLQSGQELEADIIITATGLNLTVAGGLQIIVDEQPINLAQKFLYKGVMYSDVPNLVSTFGYINASWTLRADLIATYVCRLLNHMDKKGYRQCTPRLRPQEQNMAASPMFDSFTPNYMQRVRDIFPKQGNHAPWRNEQSYSHDKKAFHYGPLADGILQFSQAQQTAVLTNASPTLPKWLLTALIPLAILLLLWRMMKQQRQ